MTSFKVNDKVNVIDRRDGALVDTATVAAIEGDTATLTDSLILSGGYRVSLRCLQKA